MKRALRTDEAFLEYVEELCADASRLFVFWLGQSGFLLRQGTAALVLDPYLSDSLTTKYADTDRPHVRITERVIDPALLSDVTVVTASHLHTDHLDALTLRPMLQSNPGLRIVVPESIRGQALDRIRCPDRSLLGLNAGQSISIDAWDLTAVRAAHNTLDCDAEGRHLYLGFVIKRGPWQIYHSGDTLWFEGMEEELCDLAGPRGFDLSLLPINGNRPERRVAGNLDGREAAQLAKSIGSRLVVPCHYDMFAFNTADPADAFVPECQRLGQPYRVMQNGDAFALAPSFL